MRLLAPRAKWVVGQDWPNACRFGFLQSRSSRSVVITQPTQQQVLLLAGCVQQAATPNVNLAVEQLLAVSGVEVARVAKESCCGALNYHLGDHAAGLADMRRLLHTLARQDRTACQSCQARAVAASR